jgi:hypothetical protein
MPAHVTMKRARVGHASGHFSLNFRTETGKSLRGAELLSVPEPRRDRHSSEVGLAGYYDATVP